MPLLPANQPQIIRSFQKDEYYQTCLRNNANETFQTFAGSKRWLEWRKEIELLSDLLYYGLTTFSGYQTLGEEYVGMVQVDPTMRRIPSRGRRGALILLHTLLPYVLDKLLSCLESELQTEEAGRGQGARPPSHLRVQVRRVARLLSGRQRRALLPALHALQQGLALLHRLHVALFYIRGAFYHLSKRVTGIAYLQVGSMVGEERVIRTCYQALGVVSMLQLLLTVTLQFNNYRQRLRARNEWQLHRNLTSSQQPVEAAGSRASRCILCLEQRRHSTLTPCGHLFCWECITEWCNTKSECPLCRDKFPPHRLVYLRNYT